MSRITSGAKVVAIAAWLLSVPLTASDSENDCALGSCSDESAVSLLQTSIDWSQKPLEKQTHDTDTSFASAETLAASDKFAAVCFIGQFRNLNETKEKLWSHLLTPITAGGVWVDVFIAGSPGGPFGIADFEPPTHNRRVKLRDSRWRPEPSPEEFDHEIIKSAPKEAVEHYRHSPGEWIGPGFGQAGNTLKILNHELECSDMIQQRESGGNVVYTWVMRTRPDILWLIPHFPFSLFSTDKIWHWDSEMWNGLNSRHMVGGRDFMVNQFLRRYELIRDGDPVIYRMNCSVVECAKEPLLDPNSWKNPTKGQYLIGETFDRYVAEKYATPVGTMPTLGYLVDCPSWSPCWRKYLKDLRGENAPKKVRDNLYSDEKFAAKSYAQNWDPLRSCWTHNMYGNIAMSKKAPMRKALREAMGGDSRC